MSKILKIFKKKSKASQEVADDLGAELELQLGYQSTEIADPVDYDANLDDGSPNIPIPYQPPQPINRDGQSGTPILRQPSNKDLQNCSPTAINFLQSIGNPIATINITSLHLARFVDPTEEIYQHICEYVANGQEHGYGVKVKNIVRIVMKDQFEFHRVPVTEGQNRMMLWHGTTTENIPSILEHGFQIPKPKNQMFGTGIYFADRVSKSCNYCIDRSRATTPSVGSKLILMLCDVMLGSVYNAKNPHNQLTKAPDGFRKTFHSVKCTGKKIPDPHFSREFYGSRIPSGKTVDNTRFPSYTVDFNEFIVYNTDKIRIQFLVEVHIKSKPVKAPVLTVNNNIP